MTDLMPSHDVHRRPERLAALTTPTVLAFVVSFLAGPSVLRASDEPLPKAEMILDKYVEATGGASAYKKLNNRVEKGTVEFLPMAIKGTTIVYSARPDKQRVVMEMGQMGKVEEGTDGEVAWGLSAMMGPQIKEGEERAVLMRGAAFDGALVWRKFYKKAECVAIDTVGEKPCYKVVMTPNEGQPETRYYDKESNLLVKTEMSMMTPMGTVPFELHVSEYKKVDGVLLPHKLRQVVPGMQEMALVTESIEHNVEIPADQFKLPDEVQALVDKEKSEGKKTEDPETQKPKPDKPKTDSD
jgi:hypothetical protein